MTCETPYKDVDSSAIIWGVGSNSLHLPIPSSCPDGFRLLIKQCWAAKPRNRPSFKHIMMHLDIASSQVLASTPDEYFKTQVKNLTNIKLINNMMNLITLKKLHFKINCIIYKEKTFEIISYFLGFMEKRNTSSHVANAN